MMANIAQLERVIDSSGAVLIVLPYSVYVHCARHHYLELKYLPKAHAPHMFDLTQLRGKYSTWPLGQETCSMNFPSAADNPVILP